MSETEQQQQEQQEHQEEEQQRSSPLYSELGTTTVASTIVDQVIEQSVKDVEGIYVDKISTAVGSYEVAVDFRMEMEYGRDLPELTTELRRTIAEQVEWMTGLQVTEQNIIVTDIVFADTPKAREREEEQSRVQ